ncbi:MAG: methylated-DNA--[protein]-cysteine S-methyltransferase [Gammaproteobacteria bacterium]|nr:methylated-DNA--[protein]-cysteine S-methyltransferase [Gammaproteobacteria bacterium]
MNGCVIASAFGNLKVEHSEQVIYGLDFVNAVADGDASRDALVQEIARQLDLYSSNPCHRFDLPIDLRGTVFQQRVWSLLLEIPAGRVRTYGDIALELSSSARAVGNACRANPVVLIVPCHRVVAKNGAGGYMGQVSGVEMDIKRRLLHHEGLEI